MRQHHGTTDQVADTQTLAPSSPPGGWQDLLLEGSSDVLHVVGSDGRIRYITPSIEPLIGFGPEELVGTLATDWVHPDDLAANRTAMEEALSVPDYTGSLDLRLRHRDGGWRWVAASAHTMLLDGEPVLVVNSHDITDRIEAEERFRILAEQDLVGTYIVDRERFIYVNEPLAQMFGRSREELLALRAKLEVVLEEDRPMVAERIRRRLDGEQDTDLYRFRIRRGDGSVVPIEVQGSRAELDGKPVIVGIALDVTERARWEEQIAERERRFRAVFDGTRQFMGLMTPDGTVLELNRATIAFTQRTKEELIGRALWDLPPIAAVEKTARQAREMVRYAAGNREAIGEMEIVGAEGDARVIDVCIQPVCDENGKVVLLVPEGRDVTERKQAEEDLRQSEERLRLVAEAANEAIWDFDKATGRVTWNERAGRIFRYRASEMGSGIEWWYDRIHPDDRERTIADFHASLEGTADTWRAEYRLRRGDGSYATVLDRGYVVRNEVGDAVRMVGSMMDITERKREEEVQRFLADASTALDSSLDYEVTLQAVARLAVPSLGDYCLIDMLDEAAGEVRRVATAHADPTREGTLLRDESVALTDDPTRHPVLRVVQSGEPVLVPEVTPAVLEALGHDAGHRAALEAIGLSSYIIVPMMARGRTLGTITLSAAESRRRFGTMDLLVAENLARRAGLAVDNARLYREAQEAVQARDEVLAVVSHDLRNPLSTILLSATLALDSEDRRAANRRGLEMIRRSAEHMEVLIQDLMDVSRIESGELELDPDVHDVQQVLEDVRESFEPLAVNRSIQLSVEADPDLPPLRADYDRVRQVFSNVIGNALKFTPEGGAVTVRASVGEDPVIRFSVTDTGPGIPPQHLPHLFDRFWRAERSSRLGAGLGLTIVRGIVEAHQGRVWVESELGEGTTISFTIPAVRAKGAEEEEGGS
jgi:PAS domain S-box-containing protein